MNLACTKTNPKTMTHPNTIPHSNQRATSRPLLYKNKQAHRISEIIIPQVHSQQGIISPLIASLSHRQDPRWLTWMTGSAINKKELIGLGVNTESIRIVHIHPKDDNRWLIWECLHKGNSHTVVADSAWLSDGDVAHMERAALLGNTMGILVRSV